MMNAPVTVSGYQIAEPIYEGSRTLVYKGMRIADDQAVIIKILRNSHPHFNELVGFRNQYVITSHLDSPYIVKPLALERHGNGYALVMPDEGAISLEEYWQGSKSDLTSFLTIAMQLADALHYLAQQRIIHKDIKSANILIHPETGQVQLIDFSIASLLPKEQQQLVTPQSLEGTLAYISPEQTGRMNRGIDYRSDFYSLGVTFYELLAGELPFQQEDPLELIHAHIAQSPQPIADIYPQPLSDIVGKLMAKNAEDRYQSALGLKYDLDRCLKQWQQMGEIPSFELGQRDMSDRFLIPEKLYGRETEVQTLLDAFERVSEGTSELMLVAGFSGIGKTAAINEVHKPIVRQRGYFIKGKYDQFNRNIPFSAFVQAFRDLMGQLLGESDPELARWKTNILTALGENGQVLIDVIPELERIIGSQPPAPKLEGSAAQNRFNLLFQKFITVFSMPEHPLVMFLDDLQWADSASLSLMNVLMGNGETEHLLLLGAYRDNEVFPAHPLMLTLAELEKTEALISTITLAPLATSHINQLVAETLSCTPKLAQPLTELVYQKTQGNPFFTTQFLQGLHGDGLIAFNFDAGYWECNLTRVRDAALTDDVVAFMARRLQKLPEATQDGLKLAACIGNQFDLTTLAVVSEAHQDEVAAHLWAALQEGLILPISEAYKFFQGDRDQPETKTITVGYRFLHDRVQQAAYSLIPETQKQVTHLTIGKLLLRNTPDHQIKARIFDIVNQLNAGRDLISKPSKREKLAALNLDAGQKALTTVAYQGALDYFQTGIDLLEETCWQTQYILTLSLHESAAEAAYLNGNFPTMEGLVNLVQQQAKNVLDTVKVYEIQILGYTAQGQPEAAIKTALPFLQSLGISLPEFPKIYQVLLGYLATKLALMGKKPADVVEFPAMNDTARQAVMKILVKLTSSAVFCRPQLLPLIGFKLAELSAKYGNAPESSYGYAVYGGFILCGFLSQQKLGYQFAQSALKLWSQGNSQYLTTRVLFIVDTSSTHWKRHFKQTLEPLKKAYLSGLDTGDIEYMGYAASIYSIHAYIAGIELDILAPEMRRYGEAVEKSKQYLPFYQIQISYQAVSNLLGNGDTPWCLSGPIYNQAEMTAIHEQARDKTTLKFLYFHATFLAYLFGEYDRAKESVKGFLDNDDPSTAFMAKTSVFCCYESLVYLAVYPKVSRSKQKRLLVKVRKNQKKLKKFATLAPMNYQHKADLVQAEKHRILGQKTAAIEFYDRAISSAKEHEFTQEEAIANELAAKFYLEWGKEKVAAVYMQDAYYCYARWGAKAKVADLETRYPELLHPILKPSASSADVLMTLTKVTHTASVHASTRQSYSSSSLNQTLDFASILQASQALSGIIQLDELLRQLTQIILQNSGGDHCALILPDAVGEWKLRAIATSEETQMCAKPLHQNPTLPVKLIQYVKNTQEVIVFDNLETDLPILDDYLKQQQPKSVLCLPMLNQGRCLGILYLQNNRTSGVFTAERMIILNFLCTQAAISLANAGLYQKAQTYAQQLERSLKETQESNAKLIKSTAFLESQREAALDGILVIDSDRQVAAYNQPFVKLWNIPQEIVNSKDDYQLLGHVVSQLENPDEFLQKVDYFYSHPELSGFDEIKLKSGCVIERSTVAVKTRMGEYCGRVWYFRDISDRKQAEEAILQKSQALETTLAELQNMQLQLVQSEKMATLGNLVAGVAHEINNPVGFIGGNVGAAQEHLQDLLYALELYQQKSPSLDAELAEEIEDLELEFIAEDFPKLMASMQKGCDRIRNISISLRTFSRTDTATKTEFNLHEGIDSTLLILKYRLKANEHRPGIEIIKQYGKLPAVKCYAGQLNQVFMNLIANAIDALDESNEEKSYSEIEKAPNRITIATEFLPSENNVTVKITDNGTGMPEEVRAKIFDQGFTTKGVGKGTGLGMAIAHQIITEKHGGTISCQSKLGKGTSFLLKIPL